MVDKYLGVRLNQHKKRQLIVCMARSCGRTWSNLWAIMNLLKKECNEQAK